MPSMSFHDLGLSNALQKALTDKGYTSPTDIQSKMIPPVLMGQDVIASAKTGSGKTAAYALPIIDMLDQHRRRARMPRAVVLSPTRELAAQVAENFTLYSQEISLEMCLLIGGVTMTDQDKMLQRGVDVLVATPGRLLDHIQRGKVLMSGVRILVIDEVDRMLDIGFLPDIEAIVKSIPANRQTLMLSATMPQEIERLAKKFLVQPKKLIADPPSSVSGTINHSLLTLAHEKDKNPTLTGLMRENSVKGGLIFCNRKTSVSTLRSFLKKQGFSVDMLHGNMNQLDRLDCLSRFRQGEVAFLVCSDVAARGLDIPLVDYVFNFDVPNNPEDYVHRIGRTGRAGRAGQAITLATAHDDRMLEAIEKVIGEKIAPHGVSPAPGRPRPGTHVDPPSPSPKRTKPRNAESPRNTAPGAERSARDKVRFAETGHIPNFLR